MTRDRWLLALLSMMRPEIARLTGLRVPMLCRVTADPQSMQGRDLHGLCDGKQRGIFAASLVISTNLTNARDVAATLAHEALHAALPRGAGHDWRFIEAAQRLGLTADAHGYQDITRGFDTWAAPLLARLPAYPAPDAAGDRQQGYPWPWPYILAAILCGLFYVTVYQLNVLPPATTRGTVGAALQFEPMATPVALIVPGALLCFALTDSRLSRWPGLRHKLQWAVVLAPFVVGIGTWLAFASFPPASALLQSWITQRLAEMKYGYAIPVDAPPLLAIEAGFAAMATATVLLSGPIVWLLWKLRPVSSFYRIDRFKALTPPFLWRQADGWPAHPDVLRTNKKVPKFSRSNPRDLGRYVMAIADAARVERVLIGIPANKPDGQPLHPRLIPEAGFVIEESGNTANVAAGLGRALDKGELEALSRAGAYFKDAANLRRAVINTVRLDRADMRDPLAPPSTEKGSARFAWPLSD